MPRFEQVLNISLNIKPGTHMRAKPRNVTDSCNKFASVDGTSSASNEQEMLVARVALRSTHCRFLPVASKECYITRYAMCGRDCFARVSTCIYTFVATIFFFFLWLGGTGRTKCPFSCLTLSKKKGTEKKLK